MAAQGTSTQKTVQALPWAATFYPTAEQFRNPFAYIRSIRKEAEKTGICKIVPPPGWRPPFSMPTDVKFPTRQQRIDMLQSRPDMQPQGITSGPGTQPSSSPSSTKQDGGAAAAAAATAGLKGEDSEEGQKFIQSLLALHESRGYVLELPVKVGGAARGSEKPVDLYILYQLVKEAGGSDNVSVSGWAEIALKLGLITPAEKERYRDRSLQRMFNKILRPMEIEEWQDKLEKEEGRKLETSRRKPSKRTASGSLTSLFSSSSSSSSSAFTAPSSPKSTTAATVSTVRAVKGRRAKRGAAAAAARYEDKSCVECGGTSHSAKMLLCDGCDAGYHMFCLSPPLEEVPAEEWYCQNCVADTDKVFGFGEGPSYTLEEYKAMADSFRSKYFQRANITIPPEVREEEAREAATLLLPRRYRRDEDVASAAAVTMITSDSEVEEITALHSPTAGSGSGSTAASAKQQREPSRSPSPSVFSALFGAREKVARSKDEGEEEEEEEEEEQQADEQQQQDEKEEPQQEQEQGQEGKEEKEGDVEDSSSTAAAGTAAAAQQPQQEQKEQQGKKREEALNAFIDTVSKEYWRIVNAANHRRPVSVSYGNDLDSEKIGSGFPYDGIYAEDGWNLRNLPLLNESLLRFLDDKLLSGITVPWVYIGMLFSSFCWHAEDHNLYSINYLHAGAPKEWYGVPASAAAAFERRMRGAFPHAFKRQPDLLFQLVTMISPMFLSEPQGDAPAVPVYRLIQKPGEIVVTFPMGYHCGFNHGFNVAEAVNFATADWLPYGLRSVERYRLFRKPPVFSYDQLLCNMASVPEEHSWHTLAWLTEAFRRLRDNERYLREALYTAGVERSTFWPLPPEFKKDGGARAGRMAAGRGKEDEDDGKGRSRRGGSSGSSAACAVCRQMLWCSAVKCATPNCCPGRLVCLEHHAELCDCPVAQKVLLYRYTLQQLDETLSELESSLWEPVSFAAHMDLTADDEKDAKESAVVSPVAAADQPPPADVFIYGGKPRQKRSRVADPEEPRTVADKLAALKEIREEFATVMSWSDASARALLGERVVTKRGVQMQEHPTGFWTPEQRQAFEKRAAAWLLRAQLLLRQPVLGTIQDLKALIFAGQAFLWGDVRMQRARYTYRLLEDQRRLYNEVAKLAAQIKPYGPTYNEELETDDLRDILGRIADLRVVLPAKAALHLFNRAAELVRAHELELDISRIVQYGLKPDPYQLHRLADAVDKVALDVRNRNWFAQHLERHPPADRPYRNPPPQYHLIQEQQQAQQKEESPARETKESPGVDSKASTPASVTPSVSTFSSSSSSSAAATTTTTMPSPLPPSALSALDLKAIPIESGSEKEGKEEQKEKEEGSSPMEEESEGEEKEWKEQRTEAPAVVTPNATVKTERAEPKRKGVKRPAPGRGPTVASSSTGASTNASGNSSATPAPTLEEKQQEWLTEACDALAGRPTFATLVQLVERGAALFGHGKLPPQFGPRPSEQWGEPPAKKARLEGADGTARSQPAHNGEPGTVSYLEPAQALRILAKGPTEEELDADAARLVAYPDHPYLHDLLERVQHAQYWFVDAMLQLNGWDTERGLLQPRSRPIPASLQGRLSMARLKQLVADAELLDAVDFGPLPSMLSGLLPRICKWRALVRTLYPGLFRKRKGQAGGAEGKQEEEEEEVSDVEFEPVFGADVRYLVSLKENAPRPEIESFAQLALLWNELCGRWSDLPEVPVLSRYIASIINWQRRMHLIFEEAVLPRIRNPDLKQAVSQKLQRMRRRCPKVFGPINAQPSLVINDSDFRETFGLLPLRAVSHSLHDVGDPRSALMVIEEEGKALCPGTPEQRLATELLTQIQLPPSLSETEESELFRLEEEEEAYSKAVAATPVSFYTRLAAGRALAAVGYVGSGL